MKAILTVPVIHPGPFKNVGSSPIPHMIQEALQKRYNCIVSVPHGLSSHELDLASQAQNRKVLDGIFSLLELKPIGSDATQFIRINEDEASASCQIFGGCALITLTLSPNTMEDLPIKLGEEIINEAKTKGLVSAIAIDAHNSINGPFNLKEAVKKLRRAAITALNESVRSECYPVKVGAAIIKPREFSLMDGMGAGGISVIVVEVNEQRVAYITIDGNNMVSGLRDKILLRLRDLGVEDGEVLTTDTHTVNGIVMVERGYHPIGERIDHERLITYIKEAINIALKNLESVDVLWDMITIKDVKVIGEKQIDSLSIITEKTAHKAKRMASIIFPSTGIILITLLAIL